MHGGSAQTREPWGPANLAREGYRYEELVLSFGAAAATPKLVPQDSMDFPAFPLCSVSGRSSPGAMLEYTEPAGIKGPKLTESG